MWKHLEHKNIVPLLTITTTPPQLVSEWMPGGSLTNYVRNYQYADRVGLVSVPSFVFDSTLTPAPGMRYR